MCEQRKYTDLISIIIPVYKVEKYLARCIDSVVSQTYENIEIILVDDGSPDTCGEICDGYARQDTRIRVIHKENGGLSDARNRGVEASVGKYITFIDSDDYIAPNYIEYLYNLIIENNSNISCCSMIKTDSDSTEFDNDETMPQVQVLSGKEACYALFEELYLTLVTAWGKLYDSEIVKKYSFPKGRKHEDEATTCKYYYEADRVVVGNACLYAYYQNPTSIMHSRKDEINYDALWAYGHRAQFFEESGEMNLAQASWKRLFEYCVYESTLNNGRYDDYLKEFASGKSLSTRVKYELKLYNFSKGLFKIYRLCRNNLGKLKRLKVHR